MAGPLSGIGGQQQIPLATPFKPGESDTGPVREKPGSDSSRGPDFQPQSTAAARTQEVRPDLNRNIAHPARQETAFAPQVDSTAQARLPRGSIIDFKV